MTEFFKYQHVGKLGTQETEGLLEGECYIFPKLDGTNASVWFSEKKGIQCGSRTRLLSEGADNASFWKFVNNSTDLIAFFYKYPNLRLFGEWLVPHTIKNYKDDAWRKFYIFDVLDGETAIPFEEYVELLDEFNLDVIEPQLIFVNPRLEDIYKLLEENTFLMKDGIGEGLVVKRYDFINKFGRQTWGKLVRTAFKEENQKVFGGDQGGFLIEEEIVRKFLTKEFLEKEKWKVINYSVHGNKFTDPDWDGNQYWNNKMIPEYLGRVWHEFIKDEINDILKKTKNPTINFRLLNQLVLREAKMAIGI